MVNQLSNYPSKIKITTHRSLILFLDHKTGTEFMNLSQQGFFNLTHLFSMYRKIFWYFQEVEKGSLGGNRLIIQITSLLITVRDTKKDNFLVPLM